MKEENLNKLKFKTTIMIVFMMMVIFLACYIVYDKVTNKTIKTDIKKNKEIVLSLDDKTVKKLYSMVTFSDSLCQNLIFNDANTYFYKKNINFDSIPDEAKLILAGHLLTKNDVTLIESEFNPYEFPIYNLEIKREKIDDMIKRAFGKSLEYSKNINLEISFDNILVGITYDETSDVFKSITPIIDSCKYLSVPNGINRKLVKAIKRNNFIIVTEKVLFDSYEISNSDNEKINYTIYNDFTKSKVLLSKKDSNMAEFNSDIKDYIDKGTIIDYKFKLSNDGNYYFYSSSIKN